MNTRLINRDACLLRSGHSEPRTGVSDPLSSPPAGQKHKVDHIGAWFLLLWGQEPGVAGPEASCEVGRSLALAARFRTFTPGSWTWCCRSRSVLRSGSLARARGSVSDFHARARNLVLPVQKRLAKRVARFRSRLG